MTLSLYQDTGQAQQYLSKTKPSNNKRFLPIKYKTDYEVKLYCDRRLGKTSCFSFMTNEPTPTLCVAFAGIVLGVSGIQYTSIK